MNPDSYSYLCGMLRDRSGLVLTGDKQYLVESRLLPVARRNGLGSIDELVKAARNEGSDPIRAQITEAMTTNETFFFRDKVPFEQFSEVIVPEKLIARSNWKRLRIWCAAASTGQEPYSLAMALDEMSAKIAGWKVEIIATDISTEVLEKAKAGLYTQFEVQRGLPINHLVKYFKQVGDMWQIDSKIRSMVQFRQLNLLNNFSDLGAFDIIYCRNVLIYFDKDRKVDVLDRMSEVMAPDGVLALGAAETIIGLTEKFRQVSGLRGLYEQITAPERAVAGRMQDKAASAPAATAAARLLRA